MKHLKLFESFRDEFIHDVCKEYHIENYTINEDGSIDVNGGVDLYVENLTKLPLKFRNVTRFFNCEDNNLASLEGVPKSVGGGFNCRCNELTSLDGCPEKVGGNFDCDNNQLSSLEGCSKFIGGHFDCANNKIITFEYLPLSIGDYFHCAGNPIYEIWYLFQDYSKIEFLNYCDPIREPNIIILDRLNYFLEEIGKKTVTKVKGYKCI